MTNKFTNAVKKPAPTRMVPTAHTTNGMKTFATTGYAVLELFSKIGASRGKDITPLFASAHSESRELALRVAAWARDAREGAGERKIYRDILNWLETNDASGAMALANKAPELGRWDDLFALRTPELRAWALGKIATALHAGDGLAHKWSPRKGDDAIALRQFMGLSPKRYRKMLVAGTNVVETDMCKGNWEGINFSHVPSLASSRYKKAFWRHVPEQFKGYVEKLVKGDKSVKVNASTVYPYDLLKGIQGTGRYGHAPDNLSDVEVQHICAQWDALPNYMGDAKALAIVDVSGSMSAQVSKGLSALDVAVSLGLYVASKNVGPFKDIILNFSSKSEMIHIEGNIVQKKRRLGSDSLPWGGSTNLHAAFEQILNTAIKNDVPEQDMPTMLLIMSDMQFNYCVKYDDSAMQMMRRKYNDAGYNMPQIVFWTINSHAGSPAKHNDKDVALISGFSPAIMKSVLSDKIASFTPANVMLETIMKDRYAVL